MEMRETPVEGWRKVVHFRDDDAGFKLGCEIVKYDLARGETNVAAVGKRRFPREAAQRQQRLLATVAQRREGAIARIDPLRSRAAEREMRLPPAQHVPHLPVETGVEHGVWRE